MTDLRFWEARELTGYRHQIQITYGVPFNWRLVLAFVFNCIAWGGVAVLLWRI